MHIPKIPPLPKAPPLAPPKAADTRIREDRDEVLAGFTEQRLLQAIEDPYAIGPGNLRYALDTLLALEAEGLVVALDINGRPKPFREVLKEFEEVRANPDVDENGVTGNVPNIVTWRTNASLR